MSRRAFLLGAAVGVAGAVASCSRRGGGAGGREVVLYSSMDDVVLRPVVARYEELTGVRVAWLGDTEATKTTGLVERLLAERGRPRADVWWSNEALGSMRLAREGVLAPGPPRALVDEAHRRVEWPLALRDPQWRWVGSSMRLRVVARRGAEGGPDGPEVAWATLADPAVRGRVGIARPHFGTTRGLVGFAAAGLGEEGWRGVVRGLRENRVRVYDGNSAVVRALAQGEIDLGLTDSDDVFAGRREGWPIAAARTRGPVAGLVIPATAGLVRGSPNPEGGRMLLDFLLSAEVEELLARSEARFVPARLGHEARFEAFRAGLAGMPGVPAAGAVEPADLAAVEAAVPMGLRVWDEVMA